jgi:hypothetical protein
MQLVVGEKANLIKETLWKMAKDRTGDGNIILK